MKDFGHRYDHAQAPREDGEGLFGVPERQPELTQPQQERGEGQSLPDVWDIVKCKARLYTPMPPRMTSEEYDRERRELIRLEAEIMEKGTERDRLILELFTNIIIPSVPGGITYAYLPTIKLQRLRSDVEVLSEKEIAEELRKKKEENDRIRKLPHRPTLAYSNPSIPDDLTR
jgi:hypothetical protein